LGWGEESTGVGREVEDSSGDVGGWDGFVLDPDLMTYSVDELAVVDEENPGVGEG